MRYSQLYNYYFNHLREEESVEDFKTEDSEDKIPVEPANDFKKAGLKNSDTTTDVKKGGEEKSNTTVKSKSSSPDVEKLVKKEVDKAFADEKEKLKKEYSQQSQKTPSSESKTINHKKSSPSKTKQSKPTPPQQKEQMVLLNIPEKTPQKLLTIYDKKIKDYLALSSDFVFLISGCLKQRTVVGNKNLTEMLKKDLITYDYCYLPIYIINEQRQIVDITLLVYNKQRRTKEQRPNENLYKFIVNHSVQYGINSSILCERGHFYQIGQNSKRELPTDDYYRVILHYLFIRGYQKESVGLYFCPNSGNKLVEICRYQQNEIVI